MQNSTNIPPLLSLNDMVYNSTLPVAWLIEDIYPKGEVVLMAGASHSGKTYLALDQGLAVAYGRPWAGHATTQTPVIYAPSEGLLGIGKRVSAALDYHSTYEELAQFFTFSEGLSLTHGDSLDHLKSHAHRTGAGLIIVDVLRDATAGIEENSAQFGDAFGLLRDLGQQTGATVLVLHHLGKDPTKGARGHSSLKDKTDLEVIVTATEPTLGTGVRTTAVQLDNTKNRNHDSWNITMELRKPEPDSAAPVIVGIWMDSENQLQPAPVVTLQAVAAACNHLQPDATSGGCKLSDAAKRAKMSVTGFAKQAEKARTQGYLVKDETGYPALWRLSKKGKAVDLQPLTTDNSDGDLVTTNRPHPIGAGGVGSERLTTVQQILEERRQQGDEGSEINTPPVTPEALATVLRLVEGAE